VGGPVSLAGPSSSHEVAVGHEERRPPPGGQQPRQRRQHRAIAGLQVKSADLTAQHRHLVAQHEQFDVLGALITRALDQQLQISRRTNAVPGRSPKSGALNSLLVDSWSLTGFRPVRSAGRGWGTARATALLKHHGADNLRLLEGRSGPEVPGDDPGAASPAEVRLPQMTRTVVDLLGTRPQPPGRIDYETDANEHRGRTTGPTVDIRRPNSSREFVQVDGHLILPARRV